MIKRKISTNLMKKLETFRVMALGEAVKTPILLIGPPGVAKTAAVIDFATAALGKLGNDDLFLLETDEGTRSNAVKGNVDLEALTTTNKYKIDSPITSARVVVINEIDKASASLRNSLLGIMNEKVLFNGKEKIDCQWNNFIATCNEIPDDEKDSPFWDRFLVTHEVGRLSRADMLDYYAKGGKSFRQTHKIQLPEQVDIDAITLDPAKLKKVLDMVHEKLSDRALSFLPTLVKNVMCVWGMSQNKALVKTASLLAGKAIAKNLAAVLVDPKLRSVYDIIDAIGQCMTNAEYNVQYDRLDEAYKIADNAGLILADDALDMKDRVALEEAKLDFLKTDDEEAILNS
jgi:MoxR-like ATPase|tara:strand:+ start:535 stop:1569 length:1035 start_codon:yes stop_codon:yes gene_type:complete